MTDVGICFHSCFQFIYLVSREYFTQHPVIFGGSQNIRVTGYAIKIRSEIVHFKGLRHNNIFVGSPMSTRDLPGALKV